jgi:tRNA(adenine34) deaminase
MESFSAERIQYFMGLALKEAESAGAQGEVPIGAVIVCNDVVVAAAGNQVETSRDATAHAEIVAIKRVSELLGRWRLTDCTLFTTLEPCPMCAGAIRLCRIPAVYFATEDPRMGCCGSTFNINDLSLMGPKTKFSNGVLKEPAALLLSNFFQQRRLILTSP